MSKPLLLTWTEKPPISPSGGTRWAAEHLGFEFLIYRTTPAHYYWHAYLLRASVDGLFGSPLGGGKRDSLEGCQGDAEDWLHDVLLGAHAAERAEKEAAK